MPTIEEWSDSGAKTPTPNRFKQANRQLARPRPLGTPRTPEEEEASRFERTELTKLTPFATAETVPLSTWSGTESKTQEKPEGIEDFDWMPDVLKRTAEPDEPAEPDEATRLVEGKPKVRRSYAMTWDDYNALNDEQRAAVDFNTLLIQAREKDLNAEYEETPQQRATYDAAVKTMFGDGAASEVYAPETVAVLQQIDFKATDETLDDFLGLKTAISEKELAGFEAKPVEASVLYEDGTALASNAYVGEAQVAVNTAALQETMAKSNQLLQNFQASAALARNEDLAFLGGEANEPRIGLGFGTRDIRKPELKGIDEFFQNTFNSLSLKDGKLEETKALFESVGLKPQEEQAFLRYVDARTRREEDYGLDLGPGKDSRYRPREEIRALVGLDAGGQ